MAKFEKFDRRLARFRDDVAYVTLAINSVTPRYIAMMEALNAAFLLVYESLSEQDQRAMRESFDKLADTVAAIIEELPIDNVSPLKK